MITLRIPVWFHDCMNHARTVRSLNLNVFAYEDAAGSAMWGKTPVPPRVNKAECSAELLEFDEPVSDIFGDEDYRYGVLIITGGSLGGNAHHTIGLYASNESGEIVGDERWVKLIDEVTPSDSGYGAQEALSEYDIVYGN